MKKLNFHSMTPQAAESLRLASLQGIYWAAIAVGNYQTVYLQNNGFPATQFGLLNALACVIAIISMTFWGTISDKTGSVRKIILLTLTLGCSLYALVPLIPTGLAYSPLLFLIFLPIINFFRAPMAPFVDNLTVRNSAEQGLNYGMIRSSGSLFFAIAGIIAVNCIIPTLGIRSTFWVSGLIMIPALILTHFCCEPHSGKRVKKSKIGAGELFRNFRFVAFLIFAFFFNIAITFEANFLPYLMTDLEIDSTNIGLILSVRAIMEIPFLFFISKLRRRFKLHHLIMFAAVLMAMECLLYSFFVASLPQMLLFATLFGLGNGAFLGTSSNYIYELAPAHLRATAHGLYISVSQVSGILGNVIGGILFDFVGGKPFYLIIACIFVLSILVFGISFMIHPKQDTSMPA